MRPHAVKLSLTEEPNRAKEIRLNDGSRVMIRYLEQWFTGPEFLYVLVGRHMYHVAYRNITAIRCLAARLKPARRLP